MDKKLIGWNLIYISIFKSEPSCYHESFKEGSRIAVLFKKYTVSPFLRRTFFLFLEDALPFLLSLLYFVVIKLKQHNNKNSYFK